MIKHDSINMWMVQLAYVGGGGDDNRRAEMIKVLGIDTRRECE